MGVMLKLQRKLCKVYSTLYIDLFMLLYSLCVCMTFHFVTYDLSIYSMTSSVDVQLWLITKQGHYIVVIYPCISMCPSFTLYQSSDRWSGLRKLKRVQRFWILYQGQGQRQKSNVLKYCSISLKVNYDQKMDVHHSILQCSRTPDHFCHVQNLVL